MDVGERPGHRCAALGWGLIGLSGSVDALADGSDHTCALMTAGGVQCWGSQRFGQLGNGVADYDGGSYSTTPVKVLGID